MAETTKGFPIIADARVDWEVVTTDNTRQFVSWNTRNNYSRADLILEERYCGTELWEDRVELVDFLNECERRNQG